MAGGIGRRLSHKWPGELFTFPAAIFKNPLRRLANMTVGGDRSSEKDSNFDPANLPIGNDISQPEAGEETRIN